MRFAPFNGMTFCMVVVSRLIFIEMLDRVVQLSANDFVVKKKASLAYRSSGNRESAISARKREGKDL